MVTGFTSTTGRACPKCGGEIHEETIENEETHRHKYCDNCSWGYVRG